MTTSKGRRFLGITFLLTLAFCILEFAGGKISGSLALTADAVHMLTDLGALGLAFFAACIASQKIKILSALANGAALFALAIFIAREAFDRLHTAPEIATTPMLVIAFIGFLFNIITGFFLARHKDESVNLRGAFLHVVSDALSSAGTIAAGIVIAVTGWRAADPIVSFLIAFLIAFGAWRFLKDVIEETKIGKSQRD